MEALNSNSHVERLRKQVSALAQFGGQALRTQDLDELLQEATRLVSDAMNIDLVKVLELLPDQKQMLLRAGVNWRPGVVGHAVISAGEGSSAGHALRTEQPVITEDVTTETRFQIPDLLFEHGVKSTVNVVIRGEGEPFGVLEVDSRCHRHFDQDDIDFIQNYANLLASAVDRLKIQRDLKSSAKKQELLLHELQHRMRNMFSTVRAIARRTISSSDNVNEFAIDFDSRLAALARTHELLNRTGIAADLRDLITEEVTAQGALVGKHLIRRGSDIMLPAKQAEALSLACHELATNAVKHGALSVNGHVEASWQVTDTEREPWVRVGWREFGVTIEGASTRRGFGSEILEKAIPYLLGGTFDRTYHSDGIECIIRFPLATK
jgi:two-component sensor histidine kinase